MKNTINDHNGFVLLLPIAILVIVLGVIGTQFYRVSQLNQQQTELQKSTQQQKAALKKMQLAEVAKAQEAAAKKAADEQKTAPAPTPAPAPVPAPVPAPSPKPVAKPAVNLFLSPKDNFEPCPGSATAYVVNPAGAKLYTNYGDASNYASSVITAPYKTALFSAGCQDGESLSVKYSDTQYVVNSADVRKTKP